MCFTLVSVYVHTVDLVTLADMLNSQDDSHSLGIAISPMNHCHALRSKTRKTHGHALRSKKSKQVNSATVGGDRRRLLNNTVVIERGNDKRSSSSNNSSNMVDRQLAITSKGDKSEDSTDHNSKSKNTSSTNIGTHGTLRESSITNNTDDNNDDNTNDSDDDNNSGSDGGDHDTHSTGDFAMTVEHCLLTATHDLQSLYHQQKAISTYTFDTIKIMSTHLASQFTEIYVAVLEVVLKIARMPRSPERDHDLEGISLFRYILPGLLLSPDKSVSRPQRFRRLYSMQIGELVQSQYTLERLVVMKHSISEQ
jgi:hypothetical protein